MPAISTAVGLGLAGASMAGKAIAGSKAANAQKKGAQAALEQQQQQQKKAIAAQQPYADLGAQSVNNLKNLTSTPGQGLLAGFNEQFKAPTIEEAMQNPGYQFAQQQGIDTLDKSAAAHGTLFSGTQGTALEKFGQDLATQNYNDVYNRAMNEYLTRANLFNQNRMNEYGILAGTEGMGQEAANQISNINMNAGQQNATQINNAAAARASGYTNLGDAIGTGLGYGSQVAMQWPSLSSGALSSGYHTVSPQAYDPYGNGQFSAAQ